jgi:hypothetical protein
MNNENQRFNLSITDGKEQSLRHIICLHGKLVKLSKMQGKKLSQTAYHSYDENYMLQ